MMPIDPIKQTPAPVASVSWPTLSQFKGLDVLSLTEKLVDNEPKVSLSNINRILLSACLAPTSAGLQPFHIHVVSDPKKLAELRPVCCDQPQVSDCEHLLVFTARTDASAVVERMVQALNLEETGPEFAKSLRDSLSHLSPSEFLAHSSNQAFIALGCALSGAATLSVGSCPMGGFEADGVHRVLQLPHNEVVVVIAAVGTPAAPAPFPKFRFPVDEIVSFHHEGSK